MTQLAWLIYLSGALEDFGNVLISLLIIGGFGIIVLVIVAVAEYTIEDNPVPDPLKSLMKIIGSVYLFVLILVAFIPPQKTTLLMASAIYSQKFIESDRGKAIVDPSIQLLQDWIQSQLKTFDTQQSHH